MLKKKAMNTDPKQNDLVPPTQHPSFSCMDATIKLSHAIGDPSEALSSKRIYPLVTQWVIMDPKIYTTIMATTYVIKSTILEIFKDRLLIGFAPSAQCNF